MKINGNIGSLLDFYKHEKHIFGRCPHCHEPFRLSDVKLAYGKEAPKDLLTRLISQRDQLQREMEDLEDEIEKINSNWREKIEVEVDKRLIGKVKEIRKNAVKKSRESQLGKTLEKIAPLLHGFDHHPYDVRPIFDPVDFVVFDGYFTEEVTDITFVEFKTGNSPQSEIQKSIRNAIQRKRVHFEERRISKDTLKLMEKGKLTNSQRVVELDGE